MDNWISNVNQSLQRIRVMLQSLQHYWWISELHAGHRAELGVHWWGLFDSKISWRSSRPEEMSCCQAKKKKRLEEMLVGAEPPIIVLIQEISLSRKIWEHSLLWFRFQTETWTFEVFVNQKKAVDVLSKSKPHRQELIEKESYAEESDMEYQNQIWNKMLSRNHVSWDVLIEAWTRSHHQNR